MRVIEARNNFQKIIFIGDTHGDFKVSKKIIKKFLKKENLLVFLGDYVDRGKNSKENIDLLLKMKENYPQKIYLLQGNHETYPIVPFSPADFWESLSSDEMEKYWQIFKDLPFAFSFEKILALHGALPNIENLKDFEKIKLGDKNWQALVWGDFREKEGNFLERDPFTGRPQFGKNYFKKIMKKIDKKILIRGHQPNAPLFLFENRCLTIFTSSAYPRERTIAILEKGKKIETAKDLKILKI